MKYPNMAESVYKIIAEKKGESHKYKEVKGRDYAKEEIERLNESDDKRSYRMERKTNT